MISVISVNWKAYDFASVLAESLDLYTTNEYELIIIDNTQNNVGHGEGLMCGVEQVTHPYTVFLDVDTHVLINGWDEYFLQLMHDYDVVGGKGVPQKPIRPACMFMKTHIAKKYDWTATPGYQGHRVTPNGYDVAIRAYHQMNLANVRIKLIESIPSRYKTCNGEEFIIDGTPVVYHHWHGTHLKERSVDFPDIDLFADKELLFRQIPWRMLQLF